MASDDKKIYIADTYQQFTHYATEHELTIGLSTRFIQAGDTTRLAGLALAPDDVVIIGDPIAQYSFWQTLNERITRG